MRRQHLALLVAAVAVVTALVALLVWLRGRIPEQALVDPVGDLPAAATCDTGPHATPRLVSGVAFEGPDRFDGQRVVVIGEVVGDVLGRRTGSWIQLNDDAYALDHGPLAATGVPAGTNSGVAVWLPKELTPVALQPGRATHRGTILLVTGTFLRADPADGGGTAVRADHVELLDRGGPVAVATDVPAGFAAAATMSLAIAAWAALRRSV